MADETKVDVGEAIANMTAELKALREVRERDEQARLKAEPSKIRIDGKVPAEPADAEQRVFEERMAKAMENSPRKIRPDEFSLVRFFNAQLSHDWSAAKYERFCLDHTKRNFAALEQKSLGWASGSSGGYWVATEFLPQEFIAYFTANVVCRKAGCKVLPCTGAPVNIPTMTAGATAYWVSQNATLTASDSTPGQLQLTPHFVIARSQISEFLAQSSEGAAESLIREDLARVLSLAIDDAMIEGVPSTATPGKPTGMANTASINTVAIGTNGGALTMAHLHDMKYDLDSSNVPEDGRCWIMHPRTLAGINEYLVNAETNNYLFNPRPQAPYANQIFGYPVYTSTQVSITGTKGGGTEGGVNLANVFLANMKDVILAEWGGVSLKATDVGGNAWAQNAIEVKATYACDVGVRHAASICLLSDTTT